MKKIWLSTLAIGTMLLSGCNVGATSKSITRTYLNEAGELIVVYSDGSENNVGKVKGVDGKDGEPGSDGNSIVSIKKTFSDGLIDTYEIVYSDGSVSRFTVTNGAQGEKGEKGDKGDTGAQGEKGEKGDKGDTGAQGEKGEKGDKGDTGAQGEKGEKGDKGDTGAQGGKGDKGDKGDTGAQGEKGDKGDTGAQGEKGDKGDTGAQGEKGDKGDTGAQGEKGDKGDTGAQGEKGDKGDTGKQGDKGDTGADGATAYSSTIIPTAGGYVVPSIGSGVIGTEITFKVVPYEDYSAIGIKLNGVQYALDVDGEYTTEIVENGFVVEGVFKKANIIPNTTNANEIQTFFDTIGNGESAILKYNITLNGSVVLNKDVTITGTDNGSLSGVDGACLSVASTSNVSFQNVKFGEFKSTAKDLTAINVQTNNTKVEFSGCSFSYCDVDAIHVTGNTGNSSKVIIDNCTFTAESLTNSTNEQHRFIDIETANYRFGEIRITNNTFSAMDYLGTAGYGDAIHISKVNNIGEVLNLGKNEFYNSDETDAVLKLQVPNEDGIMSGNIYIEDANGIYTTFDVTTLKSAISTEKVYFKANIPMPITSHIASINAFFTMIPNDSIVTIDDDISLDGSLYLPTNKNITFMGNEEDKPTLSADGSIYLNKDSDYAFSGIIFDGFNSASYQASIMYGYDYAGELIITDCVFADAAYEALQITPVDGADIAICDNEFSATSSIKRYIHIQSHPFHKVGGATLAGLEISGNTFDCTNVTHDIICLNGFFNMESVLTVGKNSFNTTLVLQKDSTGGVGNIYIADNLIDAAIDDTCSRFKVETLFSEKILKGSDCFYKHGQLLEDPLTADEAYALAEGLENDTATSEDYYVTGKVVEINSAWSSQFNNISVDLAVTGSKIFRLYRTNCTQEQSQKIGVDTEVTAKGKIKHYNSTMELDSGGEFTSISNTLTGIKISGSESIKINASSTYNVAPVPSLATLGTVTWSIVSGDECISLPDIITGTSIEVTGVAEGEATIKAVCGNFEDIFDITVEEGSAQTETTVDVTMKGFASGTGTSYITTETSSTISDVTYCSNQYIPSSGQIKGNQTTIGNQWYFYNSTAFTSKLTNVSVSVTADTSNYLKGNMYLVYSTEESVGGVTNITSATKIAATLSEDKSTFSFDLSELENIKFIKICSNEKFTNGTCKNAVVSLKFVG